MYGKISEVLLRANIANRKRISRAIVESGGGAGKRRDWPRVLGNHQAVLTSSLDPTQYLGYLSSLVALISQVSTTNGPLSHISLQLATAG